MDQSKTITGFSKLSKRGKIKWLVENFFKDPESVMRELISYWHGNEDQQKVIDGFSENTISNFILPYGVAPNFLINGKTYCVPMVIEESSVVAAASSAAKFWISKGGFKSTIISTLKVGQVHFLWSGEATKLKSAFPEIKEAMLHSAQPITERMVSRGGGIHSIELIDKRHEEENYYQLRVKFDTKDSMGANFINSVLENFADTLKSFVFNHPQFTEAEKNVEIIMSILSNYTPECVVKSEVSCPVKDLGLFENQMTPEIFVRKFKKAVRIAQIDPYRATTHNKGIFNGIDAVVIATGNDYRAVEACGHTYACRSGSYRGLSDCSIENGIFHFWLEIPLALGTVGGLTSLHPMAKRSLELLGNPSAEELMEVVAATGLAQNFAALRSLVTTGIQQGHMKMHLLNILNHLQATEEEIEKAITFFSDKVVSFAAARRFIDDLRVV